MAAKLPPLGDGPRGSRAGAVPLHPGLRGPAAQGVWGKKLAGEYRRSAEGLAARGSGVAPCCLYGIDRHSSTGLMARYKGQREIKLTLAFCAAKIPKLY